MNASSMTTTHRFAFVVYFLFFSSLLVQRGSGFSPNSLAPTRRQTLFTVSRRTGGDEATAIPYVPDGLTSAQYTELKAKEEAELAKKDFGAWGPRFHQGSRPDGDWFVVPGLWTNGFRAQSSSQNATRRSRTSLRLRSLLRNYGPSFLVACVLLDGVLAASAMLRASSTMTTVSSAASMAAKFLFVRRNILIQVTKIAVAGVLTVPAEKFMEHANRRWLWAPRRTVVATVAATMGSLFLWGMLLLVGVRTFV